MLYNLSPSIEGLKLITIYKISSLNQTGITFKAYKRLDLEWNIYSCRAATQQYKTHIEMHPASQRERCAWMAYQSRSVLNHYLKIYSEGQLMQITCHID
ncbi:hypothetical protein EGR_09794 [Echinococcus granulosus]|uniref:Uncharacterized protein n=1 Tax=Echinococcus granulosus TaxID=6210 RepID=W6UA55_ECHGR|nr:hypothetical protein EGR_09794 [Echinococcus granulosus]EUB55357.1 hypothetical protein EGR_09794 [Echinococcus granulosus]